MRLMIGNARRGIRARRGISLLDVLVSMFVLLFGLMGVAALLPVGNYFASRATMYDRAASIGEAAFHDLQARGYLRPEMWRTINGATPIIAPGENQHHWSFCIDPVGIAVANEGELNWFPYAAGTAPGPYPTVMRRLSLPNADDTGRMSLLAAERIFMSRDDVAVAFPEDQDASVIGTNNNKLPVAFESYGAPPYSADLPSVQHYEMGDGAPVQRQIRGEFTWAFTVVPLLLETTAGSGDWRVMDDTYIVSVVVFHARDPRAEWSSHHTDDNALGGIGGGRVRVRGTREQVAAITEGEWVLLTAVDGGNPAPDINFQRWYRVRALGDIRDEVGGVFARTLDVEGPDWPDTDGSGDAVNTNGFRVSVFNKAIAVYERRMKIAGNNTFAVE